MEKVHTIDVSSFSFVDKNASVTEQLVHIVTIVLKLSHSLNAKKWVEIRTETNTVPRSTQIQVKISETVML